MNALTPANGVVDVSGGRVWYRVAGSKSATPLLVLHGVPGGSSAYLSGLDVLADERPVVYFDQLGGGRSDRPSDSKAYTVERFVQQVEAVRNALGLRTVHLLGHSWGGILAVEHVFAAAHGIASLVLCNSPISVARHATATRRFRETLPDRLNDVLERHEGANTTDSAEYARAVRAYSGMHVCRRVPSLELDGLLADLSLPVYRNLWGPSSFFASGELRNYDRFDSLARLRVPVLFLTGRYCSVTPEDNESYAARTPQSECEVLEQSAHFPMLEEPALFATIVRRFLRDHDGDHS